MLKKVTFALLLTGSLVSVSQAAEMKPVTPAHCQVMKLAGVTSDQTPLACDRLRVVRFDYVDFQGKRHHDGEIMVMDAVAPQVSNLFDRLLSLNFPIQQAKLMEHFKADDDASMAANNTSSFVSRAITGDSRYISLHAYGVALDVNPVQNPYIHFDDKGGALFKPEAGQNHANRMAFRLGKKVRQGLAEQVIDEFARHGFIYWGGYWDTPIDYQHFQTSREMAEFMAAVSPALAKQFFQQYVNYYRACEAAYPDDYQRRAVADYNRKIKSDLEGDTLLSIYQKNRDKLEKYIARPVEASQSCVKS